MDRYHLAWLMVGKPKGIVRGRPMTPDEEAAYVREVVEPEDRGAPDEPRRRRAPGDAVRGRDGGVGPGQAVREVPATGDVPGSRRSIPLDPEMQRRLDEARHAASEHTTHDAGAGPAATRRAPRPERLQR